MLYRPTKGGIVDAKDVILAALIAITVGVQLGTWLAKRATSKALDETIDVLGAVKEKLLTPGTVEWGVVEIMGHRRFVGRLSTTYVLNEPYMKVEAFRDDGGFDEELYPERAVFSVRRMTEVEARREAVPVHAPCGDYIESKILTGVCRTCGNTAKADAAARRAIEERDYRRDIVRDLAKRAGISQSDLVVQWDENGKVVRAVTWKNEPALTVEQWDLALLDKLPMGPSECATHTDLIIEAREDNGPFSERA
jgi:hypothetical protein